MLLSNLKFEREKPCIIFEQKKRKKIDKKTLQNFPFPNNPTKIEE